MAVRIILLDSRRRIGRIQIIQKLIKWKMDRKNDSQGKCPQSVVEFLHPVFLVIECILPDIVLNCSEI